MKKYILRFAIVFVFVFVFVNTKAYDVNYAGCYKSVKLEYQSVDENNDPITLSEMVTIPLEKDGSNRRVQFLVLSSMPYNSNKDRATTGEQPMDALLLRTIATEGAMTVQLDGQGFGSSDGHAVPFLISRLDGRQAVDGLLAALDYALAHGIAVSSDYYTINAGYSLAGYRAVATQRYLEKYASQDVRDRFRLKRTICGGAPVNALVTGRYIIDNYDRLSNYLSLFDGFISTYRKSTLNAYSTSDYYGSGNIINKEILEGKTPASKAMLKALSKENMDEDWIPATAITDYHLADDDVVTYGNAQSAMEHWGRKIDIVDKEMTGRKWNVSLLRTARDATTLIDSITPHMRGAIDYYIAMIDGCLRDTVIADTYGRITNYKDILNTVIDLGSALNQDIDVNLSTNIRNGKLTIKTIGNLHIVAELLDSTGTATTDIDITIRPEVYDSLHSHLTNIDAKGYLHLPVDFSVTLLNMLDLEISGTCNDLYQLIENLTAIMLHRRGTDETEMMKLCEAFNSNIDAKARLSFLFNLIKLDAPICLWYFDVDGKYEIRPATKGINDTKYDLVDFFSDLPFGMSKDITPYLTIDDKSVNIGEYTARFHVMEESYGEMKLYADILRKDNTQYGRVDLDLTGVDMNADGTRQTLNIGINAVLNDIPAKITGRCSNLNDAALAGILCYGNLACATESQAQGYADAVNSNIQLELFVKKVSDDGTYPDNPEYIDYGSVHAVTAQDVNGAYYVQYCLNWMGKTDVPLTSVIKQLTK